MLGWMILLTSLGQCYELHKLPDNAKARCLDGSPYAFYIDKKSEDHILLYFNGGGFCPDGSLQKSYENCYKRSKTDLGSSTFYPKKLSIPGTGILDDTPQNPYYNWTRVLLIYCDGTLFQGTLEDPVPVNDSKIYFRGMDNVVEAFQYLDMNIHLFSAREIIVTGASAGGFATFFWSNYLQSKMNHPEGLFPIPDSGLFLIQYINPYTKTPVVLDATKQLFTLILESKGFPIAECNHPEDPLHCLDMSNLVPLLTSRFMLVQSPYDLWAIQHIVGVKCAKGEMASLKTCSQQERKYIEDYRTASLQTLKKFTEKGNSLWSPACVQHVFEVNTTSFNSDYYRVPEGKGKRLAQAIGYFTKNIRSTWQDLNPWPSNKGCSGPTNNNLRLVS